MTFDPLFKVLLVIVQLGTGQHSIRLEKMILGCKFHILGIKTTLGQHIAKNLPVYYMITIPCAVMIGIMRICGSGELSIGRFIIHYKRSVIRRAVPYHDVIMIIYHLNQWIKAIATWNHWESSLACYKSNHSLASSNIPMKRVILLPHFLCTNSFLGMGFTTTYIYECKVNGVRMAHNIWQPDQAILTYNMSLVQGPKMVKTPTYIFFTIVFIPKR